MGKDCLQHQGSSCFADVEEDLVGVVAWVFQRPEEVCRLVSLNQGQEVDDFFGSEVKEERRVR